MLLGAIELDLTKEILLGVIIALIVVFIVYAIVMNKRIARMNKKLSLFCRGRHVQDMEKAIVKYFKKQDKLEEELKKQQNEINKTNDNLRRSFCKHTIYNYDAFSETGGKLSFILCMLDANDSGILMNVVYSREGSYLYMKNVIEGEADSKTTMEEEDVLMRTVEKE